MAKKEETKKQSQVVEEMTSDNVMENIRNKNLMKQENVQKALDKIKEQEDKHQQELIQNMICCAQYRNAKTLIQLRSRRREEKITKETLTKTTALLNEVCEGKITPIEYDKKCREIRSDARKATSESNQQESTEIKELRNSFVGNYAWRADYEWD